MRKLSSDALPVLVAQLMGKRSYRQAAKDWGISTMTLHRLVNPDTLSGDPKPPAQETLRAIAGEDDALYTRLALAVYGVMITPGEVEEITSPRLSEQIPA